ncbi:MAG: hypothetical protein HON90_16720 [Halobacteriovoraceae bacterium]|nr:hypothetical protein [Halobacteriovoraceae bacterium]
MKANYCCYITSKETIKYFVPHTIQNKIIRMYLTERNLGFRLSYTEVNIKGKYPVLLEILKHKYNEVYFYSKEMLPLSFPKIMNRLYDFILAGGTIIFCIENIKLSRGNLDDFLMIEKLSLLSSEGKIENKISES